MAIVRSRCIWTAATVKHAAANEKRIPSSSSASAKTTTKSWPATTSRASAPWVRDGLQQTLVFVPVWKPQCVHGSFYLQITNPSKSKPKRLLNSSSFLLPPPRADPDGLQGKMSTSFILAVVVSTVASGVALIGTAVILSKRLSQLCVRSEPTTFHRLWAASAAAEYRCSQMLPKRECAFFPEVLC